MVRARASGGARHRLQKHRILGKQPNPLQPYPRRPLHGATLTRSTLGPGRSKLGERSNFRSLFPPALWEVSGLRWPRVSPSACRYFSPYPLTDGEGEDVIGHGRTMDLFAGAVNRENASGVLWVCDRCFKYMADGTSWEVHMVRSDSPLLSPRPRMEGVLTYSCGAVTEEVCPQAPTG